MSANPNGRVATYAGCSGPCELCGGHATHAREDDHTLICLVCLGWTCGVCGDDILTDGTCPGCAAKAVSTPSTPYGKEASRAR